MNCPSRALCQCIVASSALNTILNPPHFAKAFGQAAEASCSFEDSDLVEVDYVVRNEFDSDCDVIDDVGSDI